MTAERGLFASVKTLLGTLLGMAQTRLELIVNELEEERLRFIRLLLYSLFMMLFFGLGTALLTFLVIAAFWDTHRLLVIAIITVSYFSIALWLAMHVLGEAKHRPKMFAASLDEIAKDAAALESAE
ncbi:MAG TPA: phage holin family protein [Methylophilaceae bacterium]|jgi:uncharacterized membrane protein YqjE